MDFRIADTFTDRLRVLQPNDPDSHYPALARAADLAEGCRRNAGPAAAECSVKSVAMTANDE